MKFRTLVLGTAMALGFAGHASASIIGATYEFSASTTGGVQIDPVGPLPNNAGFCVGPPVLCAQGSGVSGSFAFSDLGPNMGQITFTFFGSTDPVGGTFSIELGNLSPLGGDVITGVSYDAGNLIGGDFTQVAWDGVNAIFTGTAVNGFNALGGSTVTFNVSTQAQAPEPATLLLLGVGSLVAGACRRRSFLA